jgi:hypothetical protein
MEVSKEIIDLIRNKGGIMHLICKVCGSESHNGFWMSDPPAFTVACKKCERPIISEPMTVKPEASLNVLPSVPDHVLQAARTVDYWFKEQGISKWELMGIRSR